MFSVLTGQVTDMSWPDTSAASSDEELSVYGYTCDGHGGDDVFPFGLLDDDPDGFKVCVNCVVLTLQPFLPNS